MAQMAEIQDWTFESAWWRMRQRRRKAASHWVRWLRLLPKRSVDLAHYSSPALRAGPGYWPAIGILHRPHTLPPEPGLRRDRILWQRCLWLLRLRASGVVIPQDHGGVLCSARPAPSHFSGPRPSAAGASHWDK